MGTLTALGMMLLGGFYVRDLPPWLAWLKWTSSMRYAYNALVQVWPHQGLSPWASLPIHPTPLLQVRPPPPSAASRPDRLLTDIHVRPPTPFSPLLQAQGGFEALSAGQREALRLHLATCEPVSQLADAECAALRQVRI